MAMAKTASLKKMMRSKAVPSAGLWVCGARLAAPPAAPAAPRRRTGCSSLIPAPPSLAPDGYQDAVEHHHQREGERQARLAGGVQRDGGEPEDGHLQGQV